LTASPRPILYVHHRPELGGAPQSLRYLIENLDRDRFEPHVYCPSGPAAESFASAGAAIHYGEVAAFTHIWASTYGGRRWLLFVRELMRAPEHAVTFERLLRRNDFAIVHLNDSPLVAAAALSKQAGIPVVWHLRSALAPHGHLRSTAMRKVIRRLASETIAINDDVARSFAVDSTIIPNAVDLTRFSPAPTRGVRLELSLPTDRPIISYFGFVYPSKGFRDFIEAARLIKRMGFDALFLMVGGPVRNTEFFETRTGRVLARAGLVSDHQREAEDMVKELDLEESVRFVAFTEHTALMLKASDIVVAPSRGPELGRPVLEACACGRPVVATGSITGGGILLPDETGLLVPRRSPDALSVALRDLINSPEERARLGANARSYAEKHFSARVTAQQVMAIYERLTR
jgi:glycosyltransferase involved in cell wall biosynthesis